MNGGASYSCAMVVALRDDDLDLLQAMADATGLGVVRRKGYRGNPQACWSLVRKSDAVALAALLTRHPLRSRKRKDFEVWKAAVELWAGNGDERRSGMSALSRAIRDARRYVAPADVDVPGPIRHRGFDEWLAGFVAGDGSFDVSKRATRLAIRLRADDAPILAAIRTATGAGNLYGPYPNPGSRPVVTWIVSRTSEQLDLARRLDGRVPGRKALEFEVWREAVVARADHELSRERRRAILDDAEQRLQELRRYRPGARVATATEHRVQRMYRQNREWLSLLRQWAAVETGPLTAMKYERWRPPESPARNTLAARFGSWHDALDAARLADRAATTPEARDARIRGGESARAERRMARRAGMIAAVKRCSAALGRFPGPTDYARWRLHNEADAPTFGTAYALFEGGWNELRAACEA